MENIIRCIVVEDYEPLNSIYANLLSYEKGITVVGKAFNSAELIRILNTTEADVVLLDIEMKGKTEGLKACREVTIKYPGIKVIMLTCHDEEEIILSAFENGAVDYILKTASLSQILESVKAAYNNSSFINPRAAHVLRKHVKEFSSMKENLFFITNILSNLTLSEREVLKLMLQGKKNREIAEIRNVELVTVKAHVSNILKKFNKERMSEVRIAIRDMGLQPFVENMGVQI